MKRNTKPASLRAVGLGVVGLSALPSANATTQITFGSFAGDNVDISTIAGYGDNVSANSADYTVSAGAAGITGTPDIGLTWGAGYQTYTAWDGRGNVGQLDFNNGVVAGSSTNISLTFTPTAGMGVLINSFQLDEYALGETMIINWDIFDNIGTLASGNWTRSTGGRDTILTGLNAGNIRPGEAVTLRFSATSGLPSYVALDNLTFDQVPEPSTVALGALGLGLGALAMRRRRK
ncbi:MAG TPA: PEP-CTERM sorting domain-containing protein [Verrucomicrobiae bacterium]|nr:PEP-CTERM sorting domain-containing protein [Verrucomicrobiae bacterium]